jgi:putative addiction module antidote
MQALKLRQVGGSTGMIVPKELLNQLNVKEGDELYATVTESGLLLSPYDPDVAEQIEAMESSMRQYREVYQALAK